MKIINKILATALTIIMILLNSIALAVENTTGIVNTETLRLRKEPSTESIIIDLLSKDDKVEILEEQNEWYKVKFKDYIGYVSKEFIVKSGNTQNNSQPTNSNNNQENKVEGTINIKGKEVVTNNDSSIYIIPLINSNVITNVSKNTKLKIINVTGGWAYVTAEEVSGWIRIDNLSVEGSNNSNPNNELENNNQINSSQSNQNAQTEFNVRNVYIKVSSANIRSKSTTESDVITTLVQNTQVKLVGEENDWYKVEVNGKSGYILKTLISESKIEVTSRSSKPARSVTNINKNQETNKEEVSNKNETIGTDSNKTTTTTSSKGNEVIAYAKQYLGCKYVYAGSGPNVFDCSGFTMYVYKHFGYSMAHSAVTQASVGKYVSRSNLQVGDLIIFNNEANRSIGHVGIYVGNGNFIHASSGSGKVIISSLSNAYYNARYVTARRIF